MYTLLKFEASWREPCRIMKEQLEQTPLHHNNVNLVSVDIDADECKDIVATYSIYMVPALVLKAEDGTVISRTVGSMTPTQIDEWLNNYCYEQ